MTNNSREDTASANRLQTEYFREYTSAEAVSKYTRGTAGRGISYLLEHDYKTVYLQALELLPRHIRERGIRVLEFGCGGGMNLLHLVSVLYRNEIRIEHAVGTDFSPRLIDAARREAQSSLPPDDLNRLEFCQAKNETLLTDLSVVFDRPRSELQGGFDFILASTRFDTVTMRAPKTHASGRSSIC